MKPDRKPTGHKLDPFAAQLIALNDAGKKLPEIQEWLASQGMSASTSCISNYLTKLRTARGRASKENDLRSLEYFPELKKRLESFKPKPRRQSAPWTEAKRRTTPRRANGRFAPRENLSN